MGGAMPTKERKQKRKGPIQKNPRASRLVEIKRELLHRDPDWREVEAIKASKKRHGDRGPGGRLDLLKERLEHKYGIYWIGSTRNVRTSPHLKHFTPNEYAEQDGFLIPYLPLIRKIVVAGNRSIVLPRFHPSPRAPRPRETPRLLVELDLERIGVWDLAYLTNKFREFVRGALKKWKKGKGPPAVAPFRYVRLRTFRRDLRRYDLHMTHGLSFRLIAFTELLERRGKKVPENLRRVRRPVREESGVARSVHRIYRAIYGKPYNAKRRRLDHPAQGFGPYHCPDHPRNCCDWSCKHLRDWMKRIKPTLPSDKTGIGKVPKSSIHI